MNAQQKIAVVGATGRVGRPLVELLEGRGHEVVAISRSNGLDVTRSEGLEQALAGVEVIVDAATGPSPEEDAAKQFFRTAASNLQEAGKRAGVARVVLVSIIGATVSPAVAHSAATTSQRWPRSRRTWAGRSPCRSCAHRSSTSSCGSCSTGARRATSHTSRR